MKSGASRIALGAASTSIDHESVKVKIIPVGLYYTNKTTFRSEALLHFGEAFDIPETELENDGQPPRDNVKALTERIEAALKNVTLNAETESELHTARIAEEIFSSAQSDSDLGSEFGFQKEFISNSNDDKNIAQRIREFDAKLDDFGLEPEHLSLAQYSRSSVVREAFNFAWKLILLLPFALIGVVIHIPAYQLCKLVSRWYASHGADDVASTAKVLAGMVFMPLTWVAASGTAYYFWSSSLVVFIIPLGFLLGYATLYTLEEFEEARGWASAIWIFVTKRDRFLRLYVERREISERLS